MGVDVELEVAGLGRRLLRWVWALGLLSVLGAGGYLLVLWEPRQLPVRVVMVKGEVKHLDPRRLEQTVLEHLDGGMLTQDLEGVMVAVEAMPWVRSASLRRRWPDQLELAVVEEVALARWGEDALVSAEGVVFRPEVRDFPRGLPRLSGREEDAAHLVDRLQSWGPMFQGLDLEIEDLSLDARGSWTLRLGAGFTLALGKEQVQERISRFVRVYPKLAAVGMPSLIDMRYSNGLAIRWAEAEGESTELGAEEAARSAALKSRHLVPPRS
jgi:cell division protein FtsQ